jgi:hypothetical protein
VSTTPAIKEKNLCVGVFDTAEQLFGGVVDTNDKFYVFGFF